MEKQTDKIEIEVGQTYRKTQKGLGNIWFCEDVGTEFRVNSLVEDYGKSSVTITSSHQRQYKKGGLSLQRWLQ